MKIHQLQKSKWLKDKARRRGRWNATGTGNYSGRGLKWQKSRSWHSMKPFFEGWQTSIVQRLPKARGFTRYYKLVKDVVIVNLGALDADPRITDAMEINKQILKDLGYIKSIKAFVKLLWHGDYAKHLTFKDIDAFSASAKVKMEKPGTVHSRSRKTPTKIVKDSKSKVWKLKTKTLVEKQTTKKIQAVKKVVQPKILPVKEEKIKKTTVKQHTEKPIAKKEPVVKKPVSSVAKPTVKKEPVAKKPVSSVTKPTAKKEPVAKKPVAKKTATKKTK